MSSDVAKVCKFLTAYKSIQPVQCSLTKTKHKRFIAAGETEKSNVKEANGGQGHRGNCSYWRPYVTGEVGTKEENRNTKMNKKQPQLRNT